MLPTDADPVTLIEGDALAVLQSLPDACADAVVTDPPYSSGGQFRADRAKPVAEKYVKNGSERYAGADFGGDNRDARSWGYWSTLWLSECLRVVKPGGYALVFTDWRQLPMATDVFQAAGFVWRGLVAWDKTDGARAPHKGYFRHQCEYVVWGTRGPCEVPPVEDPRGGPWSGCVRSSVRQADKFHVTGKPTDLMRQLVRVAPPGGLVLDPFAGSGTTGVAAKLEGRRALLVERAADWAAVARQRLGAA